jgi:hypothetical protein
LALASTITYLVLIGGNYSLATAGYFTLDYLLLCGSLAYISMFTRDMKKKNDIEYYGAHVPEILYKASMLDNTGWRLCLAAVLFALGMIGFIVGMSQMGFDGQGILNGVLVLFVIYQSVVMVCKSITDLTDSSNTDESVRAKEAALGLSVVRRPDMV